ncbi:MAG: hypothetical protein NC310_01405 [Roseburia sp.]|nr:hypothetical protein [Anaeroplasma bactoclasticum]MCM1195710.1 hypothetical protein [Roseburia sp.]MCM1556376.1 hypothetical protein [Anaeroplasma bactoclasticum]
MKKAAYWIILFLSLILTSCDTQEKESDDVCQHVYQSEKVIPTCMEEGYTLHTCQICKETYKTDLIPVVEHSYTMYVEDMPSTCDSFGTKKRHCIWCGYVQEEKIVPLGHQFIQFEEQPATCTEDGYILYQCKEDHTHTYKETIPALGHQYTQKEILIQPTCEEKGLGIFRCQNCDSYIEEELNALEHNYRLINEPNCTESVTLEYICENDERHHFEQVVAPLGHDFITTEYKESTCTEGGSTTEVCQNCGYEKITLSGPHGHIGSSKVIMSATCEEYGIEVIFCSFCGEEVMQEIQPRGHLFAGAYTTIKPATCTEEGLEERACLNNDCSGVETKIIDKREHLFGSWKTVLDTSLCETSHKVRECYLCHYEEHSSIEYHHTYGDWVIEDKPSTYEGPISQTRDCIVCGHREEITIFNHNYGPYEVIIEATCQSMGKQVRECMICGIQDEQTIPLLEHNWLDWEIITDPTCEHSGKKIIECQYCHSKEELEIPINQHQYTEWTYPNGIPCGQVGLKYKECLLCHSIIQEEFIQEHSIEDYICTLCGKQFPVYEIINDETTPFLYQDNMWISTNQMPNTISYLQFVAYESIEIHFDIGMQENADENYANSYFYFGKKGEEPSFINANILSYGTTLGVDSFIIEKGETYVLGYKTSNYCPKDAIFITIYIKNLTIVQKETE